MRNQWVCLVLCLIAVGAAWGDGMAIPFRPTVTPARWASFLTSDPTA